MTMENCAGYPQVARGVNKICSQFILLRVRRRLERKKEREREKNRSVFWFCDVKI